MNLAPMRYKDYVWPHNPETYTISFQRKVAVAKVPFGRYGMQDLGMSYRVAYFVSLELMQQPLEDYVRYRFAFWETSPLDTALIRVDGGEKGGASVGAKPGDGTYYTVKRGDTLWGIARAHSVTLTALLKLNRQIKNPNRIAVGERVKLP